MRTFSIHARVAILFGLSILLILITRLPLMPEHLYSFDSVNLALALEDFDPTGNQPQPPGYPLFVLEARLLYAVLGTPERTFAALGLLVSGLSLGLLYWLGKRMFAPWIGIVAAALLLVNPAFWYSGLTSPLRPHLALISIALAYCCWRAAHGEPRYFYLASTVLGLGGGFRPELSAVLFPLWLWAGWHSGRWRLLLRGGLLLLGGTLVWTSILLAASGGFSRMLAAFSDYLFAQTHQTSVLLEAPSAGWRRMVGRAIVWTSLGTLPWIWTLPFGWFGRYQCPQWKRTLLFLTLWFLPPFFFHLLVHIGEPDHALTTIPVLCLLGGFCLVTAEQRLSIRRVLGPPSFLLVWLLPPILFSLAAYTYQINPVPAICVLGGLSILVAAELALSRGWLPEAKELGLLVWIALLGNIVLFFGQFPLPQGQADGRFRGLASVKDAFLVGRYESSYERVRWVAYLTDLSLENIERLKTTADRPILLIWTRDAEPVWRKVGFYLPSEKIYVLDEKGDPGVPITMARLWVGSQSLARYSGEPPIRLPVPKRARLIWLISGAGDEKKLGQVVPLKKSSVQYYTDLDPDAASFRWGSFEFVPE